jgi:omega-amidase
MKVSIAQLKCRVGDVSANCKLFEYYAELAAQGDSELLIFPELSDTGYRLQTAVENASPWPGMPTTVLSSLAKKHHLWIIAGLTEKTSEGVFNAVAAFGPDGQLAGHYRKIHLFTGAPVHEERILLPGNKVVTLDIGEFRAAILVCYDLRFPELWRALALGGVNLFLLPSAFPFPRLNHWNILVQARAIENQAFLVAANRVGVDGAITFCGSSRVVDPFGVSVATLGEIDEGLVSCEISKSSADTARNSLSIFQDRRPDIYTLEIKTK